MKYAIFTILGWGLIIVLVLLIWPSAFKFNRKHSRVVRELVRWYQALTGKGPRSGGRT